MRFTSLIIELIRARPRLIVWLAVLTQAALWLVVALLVYRGPPGDLATTLAFGSEHQVGTDVPRPDHRDVERHVTSVLLTVA